MEKRATVKIAMNWLAIMVICFLCLIPQAMAQQAVELHPGTQHAEIYDKIWYLFDHTGTMTVDQARAAPERFLRNTRTGLNFGDIGPVIWLRLEVENIGARDGEWLFATRRNFMKIFDAYLERNDKTELLFSAVDRKSVAASNKRYDMLAAAFVLAAGEQGTLFVRYLGQNESRMPASISSFEAVAKVRQDKYVIFFIIAASVIALVLYSTAIFLIIGGRALLYYAIAEIALLMIVTQSNGILNTHLWPDIPLLQKLAPGIVCALNVIFTSLFARHFFRLFERAPGSDLFFRMLIGASIIYLALTAMLVQWPEFLGVHMLAGYLLLTLLWVFLPPLAVAATLRWDINYWPLIPGWAIVTGGHFYWTAILLGLLPEPPFDPELIGFISVGQAFFLAVAIVLQVRQLREDKLHTQLDLNAALQQQLQAAHANAEMLRELAEQDRLVHAAGHDSRSILLGLRNFAAGLEHGADAASVGIAAQAITHLTNDLEAVLSTTIASAAHSGGESVLALETVPLAQVLSAVRLIHERAIRDKGLRLTVRGGDFELVTDRPLLARILGNLVENARKYTDHGAIVLAARRHGDTLRIQVWDSGCGIAPDLLATLLDPGAGQMRVSEQGSGQGSGLRSAKALAARIGGTIAACSRMGHGSCFELRLPLGKSIDAKQGGLARQLWVLENTIDTALRLQRMAVDLGLRVKFVSPAMLAGLFAPDGVTGTDFVLISENFGGPGHGQEVAQRLVGALPQASIFISTYDRGVDVRAALSKSAGVILYEPITSEALRFALYAPKPSTSDIE